MKFSSALLTLTVLTFLLPMSNMQGNTSPFSSNPACNFPANDGLGDSHIICFLVPPMVLVCVTVYTDVKLDLKEDAKLKATLDSNGRSMTVTGFPSKYNEVGFSVKKGEYSGFTHEDQKMYLKAGKYKISRGKVTFNLQAE